MHVPHGCSPDAGIALHKLARAYERRGDAEQAARCHEANLARIDAAALAGQDALDALLFLAAHRKVLPDLATTRYPQ